MTTGQWVGVSIAFFVPLIMVISGFILARIDGRI